MRQETLYRFWWAKKLWDSLQKICDVISVDPAKFLYFYKKMY